MENKVQLEIEINELNAKIDSIRAKIKEIDRDNEKYHYFINEYKKKFIFTKIIDRKYYKHALKNISDEKVLNRKKERVEALKEMSESKKKLREKMDVFNKI